MTPELLAALLVLLNTIAGVVATYAARDAQTLRADKRRLQKQGRLSDQYIGDLIRGYDLRGWAPPDPPEGLVVEVLQDKDIHDEPTDDADDQPPARGARRAQRAGTHRFQPTR